MAQVKLLKVNSSGYYQEHSGTVDDLTVHSLTLAGVGSTFSANGAVLESIGAPVNATDAASKGYVDALTSGLSWKDSVRAATAANITLSGAQTIDGVSVIAGDRVLVKDQTTASENGIYVAASGSWTRALDMDTWSEVPGAAVFVEEGTANADTAWVCTADQGGTLGTTSIAFVQFAGGGSYVGGDGIAILGNIISVDLATSSGLEFVSGALQIDIADTSLTKDATGIYVNLNSTGGLETSSGVKVKLPTVSGLELSAAGLAVDLDTNSGLQLQASGLSIDLDSNPALALGAGGISWLPDTTRGLAKDASGAYAKLESGSGLFFNGSGEVSLTADVAKRPKPTAANSISAGDVVYISGTNQVDVFSTLTAADHPVAIAFESAAASAPVRLALQGDVVTGLSGLTPGARYYWSSTALTTVQPSGAGEKVILAGHALSATSLLVECRVLKVNS